MGMENINGKMVDFMKDNGMKENYMAKVNFNGLMVRFMKENIKMI